MTPFVPRELDCYPGGAYATEWVGLYKLFFWANSIQPSVSVNTGYLTNSIELVNMADTSSQWVYISNYNNTGETYSTFTWPWYMINKGDRLVIKPRIDFCDWGFDVIDRWLSKRQLELDLTKSYYWNGLDTLYVPYLWTTYCVLSVKNCSGNLITLIKPSTAINRTRIKILPQDNTVGIVQQSIVTNIGYAIYGLNTTTTLTGASRPVDWGDWYELDWINNARHKYNVEIYL